MPFGQGYSKRNNLFYVVLPFMGVQPGHKALHYKSFFASALAWSGEFSGSPSVFLIADTDTATDTAI